MMDLPEEFVKNIKGLLSDEADMFFSALESDANLGGLSCNLLKLSPSKLEALLDMPLSPVKWCKTGFTYSKDVKRLSKSPLYKAGLYYLQEASAMAPVAVLAPKPGDRVLDLCAAPGGKSVQIAGQLGGEGILVANDASATRSLALVKNLSLCGAANAVITTEQPRRLAERFYEYFDKILIDAPCSGEGMFRRDSNAIKGWTGNKPSACNAMQTDILICGAKMLKPGGRLLYSTCTFNQTENEGTVNSFLKTHPEFNIAGINHNLLGISKGIGFEGAGRIWPHRQNGEGHFLCLLEKGGADLKRPYYKKPVSNIDKVAAGLISDFCKNNLNLDKLEPNGSFLFGAQGKVDRHSYPVYAVPEGLPDLSGLRVKRSGLYLGDIKKNRFEPSHALALWLKNAKHMLNLSADDINCMRYLQGETLQINYDAEKAWGLVCVNGYPLGWGRYSRGNLKNKYPIGWV